MIETCELFKSTGLVLFRGFDVDVKGFRTFTESLCTSFVSYAGGATARTIIDNDPTMMAATEAGHVFPIPLHSEMSYSVDRPAVLWLHCERPTPDGGQTTVADGVGFADRLTPGTRRLFEELGVQYVFRHPEGRWQRIFQTDDLDKVRALCARERQTVRIDDDGSVIQACIRPALTRTAFGGELSFANGVLTQLKWELDGGKLRYVRLGDGRRIPDEIAAELSCIEHDLTREIDWQPADIVMLDNIRVLHGRREITDPTRVVYIRMARGIIH